MLSRRHLFGLAAAFGLTIALDAASHSTVAKEPTDKEVEKFKKAWNGKLKPGEKPLSTAEAKVLLSDYMKNFPNLSVDDIIAQFTGAN